jgi:lipopolysaccharide export system protein LptA
MTYKILWTSFCLWLAASSLGQAQQKGGKMTPQQKKERIEKLKKDRMVLENDTVRYQKLPYDTASYEKGEPINLISGAEKFIGIRKDTVEYDKIIGRNITFQQGKNYLYCDSAYKYKRTNIIEAFGNVRLVQDSVTLTCRKLIYHGATRLAQAREKVVLQDPKMTLYTDALDYSLNSRIGYYFGGGKVIDPQNTLTSRSGSYDTQAKFFFFKDEVRVNGTNQGSPYQIHSDTLQYNAVTKITYFKGATTITSKDGKIYAERGIYNTITQVSNFSGRSQVENEEYILKGDSLYYDDINVLGYAKGNAEVFVKKDSIFINGREGRLWGQMGLTKMYGEPYMRNIHRQDTLYLSADSLISYNKKIKRKKDRPAKPNPQLDSLEEAQTKRLMLAYNGVKIYRSNLQGLCDSLVYNFRDSTIYLFKEPILWNDRSQMTGDSISILMANNEINLLQMRQNCFIISQDTAFNFNQIKGRTIDGYFQEGLMSLMDVNGNGESIFYILDDEDKVSLTAMQYALCSNIKGFFKKGELKKIGFYNNVDGKIIPPHELEEGDKTLPGFLWREDEKPTRYTVLLRDKVRVRPKTESNSQLPKDSSGSPQRTGKENKPSESQGRPLLQQNAQPQNTTPEANPQKLQKMRQGGRNTP